MYNRIDKSATFNKRAFGTGLLSSALMGGVLAGHAQTGANLARKYIPGVAKLQDKVKAAGDSVGLNLSGPGMPIKDSKKLLRGIKGAATGAADVWKRGARAIGDGAIAAGRYIADTASKGYNAVLDGYDSLVNKYKASQNKTAAVRREMLKRACAEKIVRGRYGL